MRNVSKPMKPNIGQSNILELFLTLSMNIFHFN